MTDIFRKTTSPPSTASKQVACDSKEANYENKSASSSRPSGPFFPRANYLKLSNKVPSLNLISDTRAQLSLVLPTFHLNTRPKDPTDIIYTVNVQATEAGVLGSDICFKVPGLTSGLLNSRAVGDSLVTIFDNQLSIFQPTEQIAQAFKTFLLKNSSKLFTTSRRDSDTCSVFL